VWLADIPVATLRPGTPVGIFYVHTDHLNTPRLVTQPSNNAERWRWDSDPFGTNAPNENPASLGVFKYTLRFPGQQYDGLAGLYYNYMRDYDPATGRYVESDPIGLRGGTNTYGYVLGNPVSNIDSFGLFCTKNFVFHYYFGGGDPVDLSSVGLSNQFRNSASVRAAVNQFQALLAKQGASYARSACAGKKSGTASASFVFASSTVTNVTQDDCLFSVGQSTFFRSAACQLIADCCTKQFSMTCGSAFGIRDWFRDPLSSGYEGGGTPYQISTSWDESFTSGGAF